MKKIQTPNFEKNAFELFAGIAKEYYKVAGYNPSTKVAGYNGHPSTDDQPNFTDRNDLDSQPYTIFQAGQTTSDSEKDVKNRWKKKRQTKVEKTPKKSI